MSDMAWYQECVQSAQRAAMLMRPFKTDVVETVAELRTARDRLALLHESAGKVACRWTTEKIIITF